MSATAAGDGGPGISDLLREERVAGAGVRDVSWPEGLSADVTAEIALLAAALAETIGEEKVASSLILVSGGNHGIECRHVLRLLLDLCRASSFALDNALNLIHGILNCLRNKCSCTFAWLKRCCPTFREPIPIESWIALKTRSVVLEVLVEGFYNFIFAEIIVPARQC